MIIPEPTIMDAPSGAITEAVRSGGRAPFMGRKSPYSERGIRRVPCARCGAPSVHQWQVCANDRRYLGVCETCDIELNRLALEFMRVPNADALLAAYVEARA